MWFYAFGKIEGLKQWRNKSLAISATKISREEKHIHSMLETMGYPLVNIHITMENHHFQWENSLFLWPFSIANC